MGNNIVHGRAAAGFNGLHVLECSSVNAKRHLARLIVGPYRWWSIEVAMRYLPIVRRIMQAGFAEDVTEIGSGGVGIAPYLGERVLAVDQDFGDWHSPLINRVAGSVLNLPFADRSRRCVVSADMLEHLPAGLRPRAVEELFRVTRDLLLIAVPAGAASSAQDRALNKAYVSRRKSAYPYLVEHLEYGLPSPDDIAALVENALAASPRPARVSYEPNSNLVVRGALMRIWIRGGVISRVFLMACNYLHPLLSRANHGRCYRVLATVQFEPGVDSD